MRILAIESTCDETAAALVERCGNGVRVIKATVASSVELQNKYGGIVPEVAAREQVVSIIPVVRETMEGDIDDVDGIAVSFGPGLMGSLLIGVETAKTLSFAWKKPLYRVNHMAGHVFSNWIVNEESDNTPSFPCVALVVSGGHTDIILMKSVRDWEWIGGTRDDAVGEAYDKSARLLGFPYPGGPEISKAATRVDEDIIKKYSGRYRLPRPLIGEDNCEMSFSGLKAAVSKMVSSLQEMNDEIKDMIAYEFNEAVIEVLIRKTLKAIDNFKPKSVLMAGGVAANSQLRERLRKAVEENEISFFCPDLKYCGDNASMIGAAAIMSPEEVNRLDLKPDPSILSV